MRTRAFRPEAPNALEGRALMSVAAPRPVYYFAGSTFDAIQREIRSEFEANARGGDLSNLKKQVENVAVLLPYARQDNLGAKINTILLELRGDIVRRDYRAYFAARDAVLAITRASLAEHIRAGQVVIT